MEEIRARMSIDIFNLHLVMDLVDVLILFNGFNDFDYTSSYIFIN